jgi:hypothetical protein
MTPSHSALVCCPDGSRYTQGKDKAAHKAANANFSHNQVEG